MNDQKTILITGATDGIGLALARHYHAAGAHLILVGRRAATELDPLIFTSERYCRVDLAQPFAARLVADFVTRHGAASIDLLIHCAGVGSYGPVEAETAESIDRLLDVNVRAPLALTHALLPQLLATRGQLVFIGSVAAALPVPKYAVYGATKAALEGFARSLRVELRGQVRVQVIHPGATKTGMHAKIGAPLDQIGWQKFPPAAQAAQRIVQAIDRGAPVATIGIGNQILRMAGRSIGSLVDWAVARQRGM